MRECVPEFDGLLMALSRNDSRDFVEICSELQSSTYCASSSGCSKIFTDAATSAFQFVCLDNIQVISESITCVKNTAADIQPECEAHCAVESPNLDESPSDNNLETTFRVSHACNSTRCLLTCFKTRIGNKCRLGHKNLLDSLLSTVMHGENPGEDVLDWILPDTCQPKVVRHNVNVNDEKYDTTKRTSIEFQPLVDLPLKDTLEENAGLLEAVLVADGQIRILRYQMFDWQGNPVHPPDLLTLSRILMVQPLFLTFSSDYSGETVILQSKEDNNENKERQRGSLLEEQEKEGNFANRRSKKNESKNKAKQRSFNDETEAIRKKSNVANEAIGIFVRLAVLTTTIFL